MFFHMFLEFMGVYNMLLISIVISLKETLNLK